MTGASQNLNIAKKKNPKKLETGKLGKLLEDFDAVGRCFFFFFLRLVVLEVFRKSVMETRENSVS